LLFEGYFTPNNLPNFAYKTLGNMKRLIKKESFKLLFSSKSKEATDDLIREIIKLGDSEENLVLLFRTLNFTRFQLRMIVENSDITSEEGKKCVRVALYHWHRVEIAKDAHTRNVARVTKQTCQEVLLDRKDRGLGRTTLCS
jgi:pre-60S factor REI1